MRWFIEAKREQSNAEIVEDAEGLLWRQYAPENGGTFRCAWCHDTPFWGWENGMAAVQVCDPCLSLRELRQQANRRAAAKEAGI